MGDDLTVSRCTNSRIGSKSCCCYSRIASFDLAVIVNKRATRERRRLRVGRAVKRTRCAWLVNLQLYIGVAKRSKLLVTIYLSIRLPPPRISCCTTQGSIAREKERNCLVFKFDGKRFESSLRWPSISNSQSISRLIHLRALLQRDKSEEAKLGVGPFVWQRQVTLLLDSATRLLHPRPNNPSSLFFSTQFYQTATRQSKSLLHCTN